MEYNLIVNQEKKSADATISDHHLKVKTGDNIYDASFVIISEHHILLNVDGRNVNAFIFSDQGGKTVIIKGRSYFIQDSDLLEQNLSEKKGFMKQSIIVSSPMPAVVISVLIKIGDRVEKGQPLIIVSAMKMETTLFAPFEGIVSGINTKEGDKVMPADILVDIEKEEEPQ
ncbi:MAG: acetyl-CoA carboxylase biotin carboxyl carrier protein subunit [Desulfamplus sp.]|nr:acetyl-CoA carboxylase biotin carboxyl carrier protein subunit [Desulfamplus sp.]